MRGCKLQSIENIELLITKVNGNQFLSLLYIMSFLGDRVEAHISHAKSRQKKNQFDSLPSMNFLDYFAIVATNYHSSFKIFYIYFLITYFCNLCRNLIVHSPFSSWIWSRRKDDKNHTTWKDKNFFFWFHTKRLLPRDWQILRALDPSRYRA